MAPKIDGNSGAVFDELLQHYESKIGALKQTRAALEQLSVTPPQSPGDTGDMQTRAMLALELFQEMIDDMALGVVFEAHYEMKQLTGVCAVCNTSAEVSTMLDADAGIACRRWRYAFYNIEMLSLAWGLWAQVVGAGLDEAGAQQGGEAFECPSCQRAFPAARFAAHMDKCMGLSSRRAATRSRSTVNSASSTPAQGGYESSSSSTDRRRRPKASKRARR
ncbi:hypothetical protein IWW36_002209 [Coemansia brasiliensis]|uniref:SAGA-associated factor 11 n=1 Tax=Coemansia brasiliensis TaxID=2650707 RepID=A0A9W8I8D7_9FUNG|nr:hypothetical protein IWW36_002209 [Coemansia brasiliensis]